MSNEIQNIVDEIKSGLVLIKTSGNNPIEYYGIEGKRTLPTVSIQSLRRPKRPKTVASELIR